MIRTQNTTVVMALIAFAIQPLDAFPGQDSGKSVLEKVERTYNSLDSFQFEGTISSEVRVPTGDVNASSRFLFAAIKPDKIRLEIKNSPMGLEILSITSGTTTWEYWPQKRQYTVRESKEAFVNKV